MLNQNELLPCPFCGGAAEVWMSQREIYDDKSIEYSAYIECSSCGVKTATSIAIDTASLSQSLKTTWNQRAYIDSSEVVLQTDHVLNELTDFLSESLNRVQDIKVSQVFSLSEDENF